MPLFFDSTMFLLIPALLLSMWAQQKVRSTYRKYGEVRTSAGRTGAEVAASILQRNMIMEVPVESVPGVLTDHYDPRSRRVRLSEGNYGSSSIAAISVAAHEVGHALQHGKGYFPLNLRHNVFPLANIGSKLAFPLFLIGFISHFSILIDIGILLFAFAVLFHVVTLPVEFNASRRALVQLETGGYLSMDEMVGAKKVLTAAALTYVAAAAMAALQLVRFMLLRGRN